VHWFPNEKDEVRSSYYLEDAPQNSTSKASSWIGPAWCGMRIFASRQEAGNTGPFEAIAGIISTGLRDRDI
jgi:hypothetical protein